MERLVFKPIVTMTLTVTRGWGNVGAAGTSNRKRRPYRDHECLPPAFNKEVAMSSGSKKTEENLF